MIRRSLAAIAHLGACALMASPADACMRHRTPGKLVLIDQSLEKADLSAELAAEVRELRNRAAALSMGRDYRRAERVADSALRILKVKWQEPKPTGPLARC
jgi:hypothetical protein